MADWVRRSTFGFKEQIPLRDALQHGYYSVCHIVRSPDLVLPCRVLNLPIVIRDTSGDVNTQLKVAVLE